MGRPTVDINDTFAFDKVLFFGRTFAEYTQMFNIDSHSLTGLRILDCPSGPASFVSECRSLGIHAVGCDPLYDKQAEELTAIVKAEREQTLARQARVRHLFDENKPIVDYRKAKFEAFDRFSADFSTGLVEGRYIRAALPALPFADASFDIALSSNFLFLYSDYDEGGMLLDSPFTYDFHLKAVHELLRLARREARIYPIKGPHKDEHAFVPQLMQDLQRSGLHVQLVDVPYRDVKGAYQMMRISHLPV